jgi:hypothetical protein
MAALAISVVSNPSPIQAHELHKENIAAISAVFHQHTEYDSFYLRVGAQLGGFPGLWRYCVQAADAFLFAEECHFAEDYEYVKAVDNFVDLIISVEVLPTRDELRHLAETAIVSAI